MKKLLVVVGVVAFSFGAVSCKKECKCTFDGKDFPTVGTLDSKDLCDEFAKLQSEMQALLGDDMPKVICEWK